LLPFLIEDLTPRPSRVPSGPAAEHPNGATGISRLELAAEDTEMATRNLAALVGDGSLLLGACALSPVAPGEDEESGERTSIMGPGPLAVGLTTGEGSELRLRGGTPCS
jgi:hypothetical protein